MSLTTQQNIQSISLPINGTVYFPILPISGIDGTTSSLTYSISPSLPTGLLFSTSTGQVYGDPLYNATPNVVSSATTYTVQINDTVNTTATTFNLSIVQSNLRYKMHSKQLTGVVGLPLIPMTPGAVKGGVAPITYSITPSLPSGISYNNTNGVISGTPAVVATTSQYTITVTDSVSSSTVNSFLFSAIAAPQPISTSSLISPSHYNTLTITVDNILGTGGDGYGSLSVDNWQVTNKNRVALKTWNKLLYDLNLVNSHITHAPSALNTLTTTTTVLSAYTNKLYETAAFVEANRYSCHPLQYAYNRITGSTTFRGDGTYEVISEPGVDRLQGLAFRSTDWGLSPDASIKHVIEYTFLTGNTARYFFNQGGQLVWEPGFTYSTFAEGEYLEDIDLEWVYAINAIIEKNGYIYDRDLYINYTSTATSETLGSLVVDINVVKSQTGGQIGNIITMTIEFRNTDTPDLEVVPASNTWYIEV